LHAMVSARIQEKRPRAGAEQNKWKPRETGSHTTKTKKVIPERKPGKTIRAKKNFQLQRFSGRDDRRTMVKTGYEVAKGKGIRGKN